MKRSKFSLSHYKLVTHEMGRMIPIGCQEVLPGDTFQHATSALVRLSPMLAPVMHPVEYKIHHWFVPHRLVWDEWESFITGGSTGNEIPTIPYMEASTFDAEYEGKLLDYFGVDPLTVTDKPDFRVSALPFRAYQLIFNEFYRDQDLVSPQTIVKTSGVDTTTARDVRSVAWAKDYFTAARPWEQKGDAVSIPFLGNADVVSNGTQPSFSPLAGADFTDGKLIHTGNEVRVNTIGVSTPTPVKWNNSGLEADLSSASAVSINDLREAFALQRYKEARARYGSRYTEYLAYLGVRSADSRLQRPEYLGGGKQTLQFSEVLQTADDGNQGVGSLKGHGIGALRSNRYRKFFQEHGYIISLAFALPKSIYMQSCPRSFLRRTKEDFWQKELEHVGQQEVWNGELYSKSTDTYGTFGYQDRYDEYRHAQSSVSGEFRNVLDYWHMARNFTAKPTLNGDFVTSLPTDRIYASTDTDPLYVMVNHSIQARRMLSKKGNSFIK